MGMKMTLIASSFGFSRPPQCMSCLRRVTTGLTEGWLPPIQQHVRGKKKLAKATTINVRLLKDVPRYGRKGSIIPVAPGRMRNSFYPEKRAEYVTKAQLRELGMNKEIFERDWTFGIHQLDAPKTELADNKEPLVVDLDLLQSDVATNIMKTLLPEVITFHRTPIAAPHTPPRRSPSIPPSSAVSLAAEDAAPPQLPQQIGIYGSVSTTDIATNLRAFLANDEEGSRIVLSPEDITFVQEGENTDRVKHLGAFEIQIRAKGASDVIRRTVIVDAQE